MKFTDILRSANANLMRNKLRTILTVVATFVGAFTIILTAGINTGVNGYIDKQLESAGGEGFLEIIPGSTMDNMGVQLEVSSGVVEYNPEKSASDMETISSDDLKNIRSVVGIKSADTYNQVDAEYVASKETDKKYEISVMRMPIDSINVDMLSGKLVSSDAGQYQIALQPDYATALGFKSDQDVVGQKIVIGLKNSATAKIKEVEAVVTGVQNKSILSVNGYSWINKSFGEALYKEQTAGLPAQYADRAYFAIAEMEEGLSDSEIQSIKDQLSELGFSAMTIDDQVGMIKSFFDAITTVLIIFGVIALLAATLGIVNTLFMAVQERTREIGLMKAVGLGNSEIRLMFSIEAVMLGFWGSALGVLVALIARVAANSVAEQTFLVNLPGFTLIEFDIITIAIFILVIMFIAFLAGTLPARRASKLDPIEALRYE